MSLTEGINQAEADIAETQVEMGKRNDTREAQTEEAEHKGLCDTELGTNKDMIQKLMQEATEEKTLAETNEDLTRTPTEHKDLTETQAERPPFVPWQPGPVLVRERVDGLELQIKFADEHLAINAAEIDRMENDAEEHRAEDDTMVQAQVPTGASRRLLLMAATQPGSR